MSTKFNVNAPPFSPSSDGPTKPRQGGKKTFVKTNSGSKPSHAQPQTIHSNSGPGPRSRNNHIQRRSDAASTTVNEAQDSTTQVSGQRNKRGQVDISHLVELRPRHQASFNGRGDRRRPVRRNTFSNGPADQTTYINATYRFVIDSRVDYKDLLQNPDIPVPMEKVIRIIMSQPSACPICLEDVPEAPRMLECGHVLCYPCIFRYLDSEGLGQDSKRAPKTCPLCSERLRPDRLKPVKFLFWDDRFDTPKEDQDCILRLMIRPMGSLSAVPRDVLLDGFNFNDVPRAQNSIALQHSRLLKGDDEYSVSEYELEIQQLRLSREQNKLMYDDDGKYHTSAINMIEKIIQLQRDGNVTTSNPNSPLSQPSSGSQSSPVLTVGGYQVEGDVFAGIHDEIANLSLAQEDPLAHSSTPASPTIYTPSVADNYIDDTAYFFYQTGFEAVTKFFLSALDSRILRAAFGSYSAFPPVLIPKVESIQYGISVNNELRKRMKYLGHLPHHTSIAFLECDWSDVIDRSVLQKFGKELKQRRKLKKDRELREERNRQRHEQNQRQQLEYELYQGSGYGSAYSNVPSPTPSTPKTFDPTLDPALPLRQTTEPAKSEERSDGNPLSEESNTPTKVWGADSPSFAQAASTRGDPELQRMLEQAKPDRRGRKKLVLLSTSRAY
jgi:Zinc finger, C3HC4 type (RING finger)